MTYFFPRFKERDCGEILLASPEMHNIPRTCSSKALSTFLTLDIQVLLLSTVTTAGSNIPMDHYISYMQRQLSTFPWHSVLYPKPFNTFQLSPATMPSALLTSLMGVLRTFSGPQLCWSIKPKPDQESLPEALLLWKDVTSYMSNSSIYISVHYSPKSIFFIFWVVLLVDFLFFNAITLLTCDLWFSAELLLHQLFRLHRYRWWFPPLCHTLPSPLLNRFLFISGYFSNMSRSLRIPIPARRMI